jgi:hypothetical protein
MGVMTGWDEVSRTTYVPHGIGLFAACVIESPDTFQSPLGRWNSMFFPSG